MEIPTQQNHVYTLTCDNACEVYDVDTDRLIHVHHAGEVQSQFTAIGMKSRTSDDTAHITELFNGAPAGNGGGGYIESNLNVGHGAADAVAAQCTLTLGDPTAEGDLTDNEEHALHLDAQPALQSHGVLTVADATEGGTLTIGETELPAFAEKKETPASISLALNDYYGTFGQYEFGVKYQGETLYGFAWMDPPEEATPADLETALNDADNWNENGSPMAEAPFEATWDSAEEKMTLTALAKSGEDSDNLTYEGYAMTPFVDPADPSFSGGQDARTMEEAVTMVANAINVAAGEDVEAIADYENDAVNVTALEAGAAGDLLAFAVTGDLLDVTEQMDGGQDARTYAKVIAAINGDDGESEPTYPLGVKAEATLVEVGQITLTSRTPGADANAIVYTATGCFGGGTVKQGSTTRGKNAVEQTAFKIYLNGEELFGESTVVVDTVEANNANAVTSNAVWNALQDVSIETDAAPTQGSPNAVSSGGVYTALQGYLPSSTLTSAANVTGNWTLGGQIALTGKLNGLAVERMRGVNELPTETGLYAHIDDVGYGRCFGFFSVGNGSVAEFGVSSTGRGRALFFDYTSVGQFANVNFNNAATLRQDNTTIVLGQNANSTWRKILQLRGSSIKLNANDGTNQKEVTLDAAQLTLLKKLLDNADALLALLQN